FTHRATSGLAFLAVVALTIWAFRATTRGSALRKAAGAAMVFMVLEALVGAWLVLAGLVADATAIAPAWVMGIHLVPTLMVVAALTLTAWFGSGAPDFRVRGQGAVGVLLWTGIVGMVLLGVSGAVTALGDTLFRV